MTRFVRLAVVGAVALSAAGCYKATVDTGRPPSGQVIEKEWAHGFVYGLVPPSTVETAAKCPTGVAKVETQLSFLNQLASFLTGGLYTPMTITAQCAAPATAQNGNAEVITVTGETASLSEALNVAANRSAAQGEPVYVVFQAAE